jgi:RNA polymerase sigma factor (sigma-70 family)
LKRRTGNGIKIGWHFFPTATTNKWMHDMTDMDLLRQYADGNSDEAFAVLVSRHVDLVFAAALRKTGNPHAAEEITQAVFIILAQKAGRIVDKTILPGWLYQTARLTASSFLRRETRRVRREQEAYMLSQSDSSRRSETKADETWEQLAPLLEDAMGQLGDKDRVAVVLRFLGGKSFAEVAVAAGVSENAAKKRVIHALEKLHRYFSKRGVSSTTAIIADAISTHSVQTAPVALAKAVTAIAVSKGAAASGSTLTLIKGALKLMAWTKAKTAIVVGVGMLLAAGTATTFVVQHKSHSPLPQIHIKARFVEIPKGSDDSLNSYHGFTGILEPGSARTLLRTLESKPGFKILSEPEVTTVSGRQTQMRSTQILTIITNSIFEETKSAGAIMPQTGKMEIGPILDIEPAILANSRIQITTTASVTYFLGYADGSNLLPDYATNSAGEQITLPIYLPAFQIKKAMTNATLADGQTLLLVLSEAEPLSFSKPNTEREARVAQHIAEAERKNGEKTVLVLVTTDMVDAAGNRLHPNTR